MLDMMHVKAGLEIVDENGNKTRHPGSKFNTYKYSGV